MNRSPLRRLVSVFIFLSACLFPLLLLFPLNQLHPALSLPTTGKLLSAPLRQADPVGAAQGVTATNPVTVTALLTPTAALTPTISPVLAVADQASDGYSVRIEKVTVPENSLVVLFRILGRSTDTSKVIDFVYVAAGAHSNVVISFANVLVEETALRVVLYRDKNQNGELDLTQNALVPPDELYPPTSYQVGTMRVIVATPTPTSTLTETPSPTPSATDTPIPTPMPTETATETPTATATPTETATPDLTATRQAVDQQVAATLTAVKELQDVSAVEQAKILATQIATDAAATAIALATASAPTTTPTITATPTEPPPPTFTPPATDTPTLTPTATPSATDSPTPTPTPLIPFLHVSDQESNGFSVTIDEVAAAQDGWIRVYYRDPLDNATLKVVGQSPVSAGVYHDFQVLFLDLDKAVPNGAEVQAVLHVDSGGSNEFDFPAGDPPVSVDGRIVQATFRLTTAPVAIEVVDQTLIEYAVKLRRVQAAAPGWLVLYRVDPKQGTVIIGSTRILKEDQNDVSVPIALDALTPGAHVLQAALHLDTGRQGIFEFPSADPNVLKDGQPVVTSFQVDASALASLPTPTPTLPPPTPTPLDLPALVATLDALVATATPDVVATQAAEARQVDAIATRLAVAPPPVTIDSAHIAATVVALLAAQTPNVAATEAAQATLVSSLADAISTRMASSVQPATVITVTTPVQPPPIPTFTPTPTNTPSPAPDQSIIQLVDPQAGDAVGINPEHKQRFQWKLLAPVPAGQCLEVVFRKNNQLYAVKDVSGQLFTEIKLHEWIGPLQLESGDDWFDWGVRVIVCGAGDDIQPNEWRRFRYAL